MDAVASTRVSGPDPSTALGAAFASRAEQLRGNVFDLFAEPTYFPELLDARSCVLIGGRGTGKTTVLRGLSYEGRASLALEPPASWPYYGSYIRINTARVTAFEGLDLPVEDWQRVFSHYLNLLLVESVLRFLVWFEARTGVPTLLPADCASIAATFGVSAAPPADAVGLKATLEATRTQLEIFVNNVVDKARPTLSMLGAPIDEVMTRLATNGSLAEKPFFFLLDEYENLSPHQQRVANTLVKHAGEFYAFKIGVKELGWRSRSTLNAQEQLQAPADYAQIDITERLRKPGAFSAFAKQICAARLEHVSNQIGVSHASPPVLLPALSEDAEAHMLGIADQAGAVRQAIAAADPSLDLAGFDALPALFQYLLGFWASGHGRSEAACYADYLAHPKRWETRYGNYKHALLYTLRTGRRGIRKYYSGFDAFVELAGTNLRFLMQLVEQALRDQLLRPNQNPETWLTEPISPEVQTRAARSIGQRNLVELEGLSLIGPRLTRLTVGLGRVFQLLASHPEGHTPEVTQFRLSESGTLIASQTEDLPDPRTMSLGDTHDVAGLMAEAITHLAILRMPGTKLAGSSTREDDYMVHPVFTPVFDFSYRRKRKMTLTGKQLLGLVSTPGTTIGEILRQTGREINDDVDVLPDQMQLFDSYLRSE